MTSGPVYGLASALYDDGGVCVYFGTVISQAGRGQHAALSFPNTEESQKGWVCMCMLNECRGGRSVQRNVSFSSPD